MKIIILNHKMNLYYEELSNYIERINNLERNIIIAPSNIYLLEFIKKCKHKISSQDICYIEQGNYTSKVSWHQMKSIGIKYSIIGHSEKFEDINKTNLKLKACLENNIKPILCFGNNQDPLELIDILTKDTKELINKLTKDIESIDNIIFAYEPEYNINKENININEIKQNIKKIYQHLTNKYQTKPTLLYGGGINEHNINDIYNIEELQGILIGSISSNIDELENLLLRINEK